MVCGTCILFVKNIVFHTAEKKQSIKQIHSAYTFKLDTIHMHREYLDCIV